MPSAQLRIGRSAALGKDCESRQGAPGGTSHDRLEIPAFAVEPVNAFDGFELGALCKPGRDASSRVLHEAVRLVFHLHDGQA